MTVGDKMNVNKILKRRGTKRDFLTDLVKGVAVLGGGSVILSACSGSKHATLPNDPIPDPTNYLSTLQLQTLDQSGNLEGAVNVYKLDANILNPDTGVGDLAAVVSGGTHVATTDAAGNALINLDRTSHLRCEKGGNVAYLWNVLHTGVAGISAQGNVNVITNIRNANLGNSAECTLAGHLLKTDGYSQTDPAYGNKYCNGNPLLMSMMGASKNGSAHLGSFIITDPDNGDLVVVGGAPSSRPTSERINLTSDGAKVHKTLDYTIAGLTPGKKYDIWPTLDGTTKYGGKIKRIFIIADNTDPTIITPETDIVTYTAFPTLVAAQAVNTAQLDTLAKDQGIALDDSLLTFEFDPSVTSAWNPVLADPINHTYPDTYDELASAATHIGTSQAKLKTFRLKATDPNGNDAIQDINMRVNACHTEAFRVIDRIFKEHGIPDVQAIDTEVSALGGINGTYAAYSNGTGVRLAYAHGNKGAGANQFDDPEWTALMGYTSGNNANKLRCINSGTAQEIADQTDTILTNLGL
ncbi:hypothetical protein ACFLZ7_00955 [Nanoarchaeota archaeon]